MQTQFPAKVATEIENLKQNDADLSLNQAKICKSQFRNGKINLS